MAYKEKSGYCSRCCRQVLARRGDAPHTFWLIATLFSCGFFLIFWLIHALVKGSQPFLCTSCGSPVGSCSPAIGQAAMHGGQFGVGTMPLPPPPAPGLSINAKIIIGLVGLFVVLPVAITFLGTAVKPAPTSVVTTSQPALPQSNSVQTKSAAQANSQNYKIGYQKGFQEGKRWSLDPEQGMPMQVGLEQLSKNVASVNGKGDDSNWQSGWLEGFKKGFASGRGGTVKIAEEDVNFERLSWENAGAGAKLYNSSEKHQATITAVNQSSGMIIVRYVNGTVEPKLLDAVARVWFVKKN